MIQKAEVRFMRTIAEMLAHRNYALLLFSLVLFGAFFNSSTIASGETLFGKDGWVLFHTDKEGTRYYYDEKSVVAIADGRSARYISVYSTPKSDSYIYGYVVDAQAKCGLLFYKIRIMNMQPFGKNGPDDLLFYPTPPDDEFRRASAGNPTYYFAQEMCKLNR
jgi:hypothetical protein